MSLISSPASYAMATPSPVDKPQVFAAVGKRIRRVALMPGCGQQVLAPEVNEATVRLLTRHDVEVVNVAGSGCCGSSVQHIGDNEQALHWISEGIRLNKDSHWGTEWLHVKILEAKIAAAKDPEWIKTHSVLELDFGKGEVPVMPATLPNGLDARGLI